MKSIFRNHLTWLVILGLIAFLPDASVAVAAGLRYRIAVDSLFVDSTSIKGTGMFSNGEKGGTLTDRKVNYKFPMVIAFKEEKIALLEEINGRLQVFWDFDYPKNLKIKCDPKDEVLTPAEKNYRAAYSYSFFLVNIDLTPFVLGFYFSGHIGGDTHRLAKTGLGLLAGTGLYDIRVDICSDEDDFDPCGNSVLIEDDSIITIGDIYDRRFLLWGGNAQFTMYEYYTEDLAIDILSAYFWVVYTKLDMEFKQAKRNQSYDHTLEFRMDMIALEVFSFTHFF